MVAVLYIAAIRLTLDGKHLKIVQEGINVVKGQYR